MCKKIIVTFMLLITLAGCASKPVAVNFGDLEVVGSMELDYAQQFGVDYLADGCSLVTINESGRFLIVPEGQEPPHGIDSDITVLRQPIENIYLAATSAMCLFDALDGLGHISMSGTRADGWYIENARDAMERGDIAYAGKYSAPDYEMLIAQNCGLAIQSTMIYHKPEVQEKLETLGISVLVERSSYEPHPLGRTEWIKLYGLLCEKEKLAESLFHEQTAYLAGLSSQSTGKTVAFFYISSSGGVVARKSGDYAVKMIELAGGEYVFADIGNQSSATGSVNLEMERFYLEAKDADIIIYNSSIDGEVHTLDELLAKSHLLADFKAVQSGDVWCTSKNLFQETTEFGLMISDMNRMFSDDLGGLTELNYYYKLR
jgi:iron complex transport system substrate-binding protein